MALPAGLLLVVGLAALLPDPRGAPLAVDLPRGPWLSEEPTVRVKVQQLRPGGTLDAASPETVSIDSTGAATPWSFSETLRWDGTHLRSSRGVVPLPVVLRSAEEAPVAFLGHTWWGVLMLVAEGNNLLVINRLPLEKYLEGVIVREMGLAFPDEALRAQAVASRSYAVRRILNRGSRLWDLESDERHQVYRGIAAESDRPRLLVESTAGVVIRDGDDVLDAVFSSTCGGRTRPADEAFGGPCPPALTGVPCDGCADAPRARWTVKTPLSDAARRLGLPPRLTLSETDYFPSGRLREATFAAGDQQQVVNAQEIRRWFRSGIHSTWIADVRIEDDTLWVDGRGFGHGVGLCQYGARGLARRGLTVREILAHYYPGASLVRAW